MLIFQKILPMYLMNDPLTLRGLFIFVVRVIFFLFVMMRETSFV